ncbi:MAG: hypothetical protein R6W96_01610 [Clostridia bacterium]
MKKFLLIFLSVVLASFPVHAGPAGYQDLFDEYMAAQSGLQEQRSRYDALVEGYEQALHAVRGMSSFSTDEFSVSNMLINKGLGSLRLGWGIDRAREACLSGRALAEISFRNTYKNLHDLEKARTASLEAYEAGTKAYDAKTLLHGNGLLSGQDLRIAAYQLEMLHADMLARERAYHRQLRLFNLELSKDYETPHEWVLREEMMPVAALSDYLGNALAHSPELNELRRKIEENRLVVGTIAMYRTHLSYYAAGQTYRQAVIDLNIADIMLKAGEGRLARELERGYEDLKISREELALSALQVEILRQQSLRMMESHRLGYVDRTSADQALVNYEKALEGHAASIHSYNTRVLSYERNAAWFMKGDL